MFSLATKNKIVATISETTMELIIHQKRNVIGRHQKKNSLELEAFLTTLERNIFCNTKPNDVKDDLSEEKRSALKNWRNDVQFDKKSELVMRLQEKGYVIVDKEIDQRKAQQEIAKSSFQDCNYDPTKEHIEKVEQ